MRISELVHMPDPLVRQQLFQNTIGQVAYGITAIGAHGWGLIALTGDALESLYINALLTLPHVAGAIENKHLPQAEPR